MRMQQASSHRSSTRPASLHNQHSHSHGPIHMFHQCTSDPLSLSDVLESVQSVDHQPRWTPQAPNYSEGIAEYLVARNMHGKCMERRGCEGCAAGLGELQHSAQT